MVHLSRRILLLAVLSPALVAAAVLDAFSPTAIGCSAVDPFRALGSERYSCWTCGSSIDAAAARCKDVCLPEEWEEEAYAARERAAEGNDEDERRTEQLSASIVGAGRLSSSPLPSSATIESDTLVAHTQDEGMKLAAGEQAVGESAEASSTMASSATPSSSQDEPFLSFEEWKALQFAQLGSQAISPAPVLSPSPIVDGSQHQFAGGHSAAAVDAHVDLPAHKHASPSASPTTTADNSSLRLVSPPSPSVKSPSRRFNYASLDCSARVHYSSPQTRSPSALLHKSKDRYMLTPCSTAAHYVVIELCDEIRIDTLEVGNFEFFSSVVKDVRVRAGESEGDGREEEEGWKEIGTFRMANLRGMQPFKFDPPTGFHRYLRLDFIGHYGTEYYCPVSLVRVYGMNQMEAYRYDLGREAQANGAGAAAAREAAREEEAARVVAVVDPEAAPAPVSEDESAAQHERADAKISPPTAIDVRSMAGTTSPTSTLIASHTYPTSEATSMATQTTGTLQPSSYDSALSSSSTHSSPSQASASTAQSSLGADDGPPNPFPSNSRASSSGTLTSNIAQHPSASSAARGSSSVHSFSTTSPSDASGRHAPSPAAASSASASTNTSIIASSKPQAALSIAPRAPSNHRPPQPQASQSDSGESIYSSIVRRLVQLESTTSLATHFIEEQSRLVRDAMAKLERDLREWKAGIESAEKTRWAGGLEGLRSQQERMLRSTTREYDAHRREFERERREMAHRVALLHSEITLHRWLLAAALLLLLVLLAGFFAIRVGSVEMVPVPEVVSRATQKIKERNRRSTGDIQDVLRRRTASPLLRGHGTPRPSSPTPSATSDVVVTPLMGSVVRPRPRHHSNTPTKRSLSLLHASGTPLHLATGRSVEVSRTKSILSGTSSHRKAAREAHIHTLANARLLAHAKKRSFSGAGGDQTPKRRFGELALHPNIGLGISHGQDAQDGQTSSERLDKYEEGWTPATTDEEDSDGGGGGLRFPTKRSEVQQLEDVKVPGPVSAI